MINIIFSTDMCCIVSLPFQIYPSPYSVLLGASKGWSLTICINGSSYLWFLMNLKQWEAPLGDSFILPAISLPDCERPLQKHSSCLCSVFSTYSCPCPAGPESSDLRHSYQPRGAPSCLTEFPYACWYLGRLLPHYTPPHVPHCGTPSAF